MSFLSPNSKHQPNQGVFQDWLANPRNPKIQLTLLAFRCVQRIARAPLLLRILGVPILVTYRIIFDWIFGIELHWNLEIGPRLRIYHGTGLVVTPESRLGSDCILRHTTTLGLQGLAETGTSGAPILGDFVEVGAHVVILGPVRVGDRAIIGAGSVVTKDVAAGSIVAGNPAREIGRVAYDAEGGRL